MNNEQQLAFHAALQGKSLFLTGPGGTGKSYLIHHITTALTASGKKVAVTALTGCAALLLGTSAKTIHSWAGIGLAKDPASTLIAQIRRMNKRALRRWVLTHTLIIDEVSMMTCDVLEKLDAIGRALRCRQEPFGGIQLLFVGDFFQLPPIQPSKPDAKPESTFLFESPLWKQMNLQTIVLQTIVRQSDPVFQKILSEVRVGNLTKDSIDRLKQRENLPWRLQEIQPTLLFPRRAEVDMINEVNLKALKGPKVTYEVKTVFDPTTAKGLQPTSPDVVRAVTKLDKDAPYKPSLTLRTGAQVMLVYNLDPAQGLVNGSRGILVGFTEEPPSYPLVRFRGDPVAIPIGPQTWESEEVEGVCRSQIPLVLAYACTIHRAQGATLDSALIDIGDNIFEKGQAYVALSRVKSLDSLYIHSIEPSAIQAHPSVVKYYETLMNDTHV